MPPFSGRGCSLGFDHVQRDSHEQVKRKMIGGGRICSRASEQTIRCPITTLESRCLDRADTITASRLARLVIRLLENYRASR